MARKRKSLVKKSKGKKIILNKYKLSVIFISIWLLFFFGKFIAPGSVLDMLFDMFSNVLFWKLGANVFYLMLIWIGVGIIFLPKILTHRKRIFVLLVVVLSIINFPIIETWAVKPDDLGWRLGYIWLWAVSSILSGNIFATKMLFIVLALALIVWTFVWLNIKVKAPQIQLELGDEEAEDDESATKKDIKEKLQKAVKPEKKVFATENEINPNVVAAAADEDKQWSLFGMIWDMIKSSKSKKEDKKNTEEVTVENNISMSEDNEAPTESRHENAGVSSLKNLIKERFNQKVAEKEQARKPQIIFNGSKPTFSYEILKSSAVKEISPQDEEVLTEKALAIKSKLEEFDIKVEVKWFNIWPTVIQIKIEPDAGVKISKIENYKKDLALAIKTKSLRILTPIPGTGYVWIEIPNPLPQMVRIREIIQSSDFTMGMQKNYTNLAIGKSIDWTLFIKSLEDMPHLLIAWATWSGKSVWVNDFITSLIYQNTPSELKFIMIDPKQVELWLYEWIPYLLSPIITQSDKAVKVLKRAVDHMEERYFKLKEHKVRNLDEYNEKVPEAEKMYRIVIIIDELADLMMSGKKKETEESITRIAQKARAVWMHLILATQRPSVNVITWLIKANVPTRIAFSVVSQIDSRTILDMKWAEDLVGYGDLLYVDPKNKFPIRIQAPFIETGESEKIVNEIKEKYMVWISEEDIYLPEIINILTAKAESAGGDVSGDGSDDDLVNQAIEIVESTRKASATLFQRKLGIGFARAARIMDILEDRGVVWPQEGAKPREILI